MVARAERLAVPDDPMREIEAAAILGVSHQRVNQLRAEGKPSSLSLACVTLLSGCEPGRSDRGHRFLSASSVALASTSYCWPCEPITPPHDTFHEVTARRIYCIGSRCLGRVLGPDDARPSEDGAR